MNIVGLHLWSLAQVFKMKIKIIFILLFTSVLSLVMIFNHAKKNYIIYSPPVASMSPALKVGENYIFRRYISSRHLINRGSIVLLDMSDSIIGDFAAFRVIGFPNEKIELHKNHFFIDSDKFYYSDIIPNFKNSQLPGRVPTWPHENILLDNNSIYVIGDDFWNVWDSRYFGGVNLDKVVGIFKK
jgi:signal peptidase I